MSLPISTSSYNIQCFQPLKWLAKQKQNKKTNLWSQTYSWTKFIPLSRIWAIVCDVRQTLHTPYSALHKKINAQHNSAVINRIIIEKQSCPSCGHSDVTLMTLVTWWYLYSFCLSNILATLFIYCVFVHYSFSSGEVCIWDLNREDDALIFTSGIGDDSHREPVTQVLWLQDPDKPKRYNVSVCLTVLSFLTCSFYYKGKCALGVSPILYVCNKLST